MLCNLFASLRTESLKQIGLYTYFINQSHRNMEFLTLSEFLDANSLEHKLQAQIKAALDAADNSEGMVKTENDTEPT